MSSHPSVRRLMSEASGRDAMRVADLVFAYDFDGSEFLAHGDDALLFVMSTGWTSRMRVLRVAIDSRTDDLEALAAAIMVTKGVEKPDFLKESPA
jgi:hypothetical protein